MLMAYIDYPLWNGCGFEGCLSKTICVPPRPNLATANILYNLIFYVYQLILTPIKRDHFRVGCIATVGSRYKNLIQKVILNVQKRCWISMTSQFSSTSGAFCKTQLRTPTFNRLFSFPWCVYCLWISNIFILQCYLLRCAQEYVSYTTAASILVKGNEAPIVVEISDKPRAICKVLHKFDGFNDFLTYD